MPLNLNACVVLDAFVFPCLARRLESEVKHILQEISQTPEQKKLLIKGRQVDLAEELSKFLLFLLFFITSA